MKKVAIGIIIAVIVVAIISGVYYELGASLTTPVITNESSTEGREITVSITDSVGASDHP